MLQNRSGFSDDCRGEEDEMIGRICEFIKVDGEYFSHAGRGTPSMEDACKKEAVKIVKFDDRNAFFCEKHYDRWVKWLEETE
jgi:hypothetical protein